MNKLISVLLIFFSIMLCMPGISISARNSNPVKSTVSNKSGVLAPRPSGRAVNGTRLPVEMDYCIIKFLKKITVQAGMNTGMIYGQVFKAGVTETPGPNPSLIAELGYGPAGTDPRSAAGWLFFKGSYNVQIGNNDEYQASFMVPAAGSYAFCWRFSLDGNNWTYADMDGAGHNQGLAFDPAKLGELIVTP